MDAIISLVAAFSRLPKAVPNGALRFVGAVTLWPTKYEGGSDTGSASITVGDGRTKSVFGLYLPSSVVTKFAADTEPGVASRIDLSVNVNAGNPQFEVVSIEPTDEKPSRHVRLEVPAPVVLGVSAGQAEILLSAESESALRISAPAGMAFHEGLAAYAGQSLPAMTLGFERRLVAGDAQPPITARMVEGDERILVPAHPMADLEALTR